MNPDRTLFARLTINGEKKSLGQSKHFKELIERFTTQYIKAKSNGKCVGILEFSYEPLPDTTILSREQQLEYELQAQMVTFADDEVMENGIVAAKFWQMTDDEDFTRYRQFCQPANRVGVDNHIIEDCKRIVFERFGEDIHKFLQWRDS